MSRFYPAVGKRAFDVVVAGIGLVALSPLFVLLAVLVRASSPGPAIYLGTRVGRHGRDFQILKFRTMWNRATNQLTTALDDARITPIGKRLRRFKLDELPQLVNVLRGDMSLVGPRPEFRAWVERYDERDRICLTVRPGITDFASLEFIDLDRQVGADDADEVYFERVFARKNELRRRYVEELSWGTDVRIIAGTLRRLTGRG